VNKPDKPCGNADCGVSTSIHGEFTFGRGHLDDHGFWEIPCETCKEAMTNRLKGAPMTCPVETTKRKRAMFDKPVSLQWPASESWYDFLKETHRALGRAERLHYDDKDILLVYDLVFVGDGHYEYLAMFDATMIRFNERSAGGYDLPERECGLKFRVYVSGHHRVVNSFEYERL
jgi:hypothetical protein